MALEVSTRKSLSPLPQGEGTAYTRGEGLHPFSQREKVRMREKSPNQGNANLPSTITIPPMRHNASKRLTDPKRESKIMSILRLVRALVDRLKTPIPNEVQPSAGLWPTKSGHTS